MAFPTSFDESNAVLSKPPDMTHEECESLSVCKTIDADSTPVVISCWKLTREELEEINRTGRVWLGILGETMPPAWIAGQSPFSEPQ